MTGIGVIRKLACDKCADHCGISDETRDEIESVCPIGSWNVIRIDSVPTAPKRKCSGLKMKPDKMQTEGPKLWEELHGRALAFEGNVMAELDWLQVFHKRLPCGKCRKHWSEILRVLPMVFSSRDDYFKWTVDAHNEVNKTKDTPSLEMTLADALSRWHAH